MVFSQLLQARISLIESKLLLKKQVQMGQVWTGIPSSFYDLDIYLIEVI